MIAGDSWLKFLGERLPELGLRTGEHLMLTGVSTGIAILLGIPLGVCAARVRWLRGPVTGSVSILQTIPSLAMLAILLAMLHKIGVIPAIIALILYALLPIVRNTLAGLDGVSPAVVEAARGIGMTPQQQLWLVDLPLSMPVIVAGVRTAAVMGVGVATLSAFIGAGGLGQFINRGLALSNTNLILLGAIPAAILALLVDGSIAAALWGLRRKRSKNTAFKAALNYCLRPVALASPVILVASGCLMYFTTSSASNPIWGNTVRIGTKNFTEQLILGELMAQIIEGHTDLTVERRFNLGGTMICHGALQAEEIDLYAEYTGTALTAILERPVIADPDSAHQAVNREYERRFSAEWLRPFGFNNTYAITIRKSDAISGNLQKISDLVAIAGSLRAGFTAEFSERPDGYPGLRQTYGLQFGQVRDLDPGLMYQAIKKHEVDVICAFATDGRIPAYELQPLQDDRGLFPPYQAAPVVRKEIIELHPQLHDAIELLAGLLDNTTMQSLNFKVDQEKHRPGDVARRFLQDRELIGKER